MVKHASARTNGDLRSAPKRPRCSVGINGFAPRTRSSCTAQVFPSGSEKPKKVPPSSGLNRVISLTSTPRWASSRCAVSASLTHS